MRLVKWIRSALGGGPSVFSSLLVDGEKLAESREGRTGPAERFRALQYLSRIAEREKLQIAVAFAGRPLREAADGETYSGVRVYYADESEKLADRLEKLARKMGPATAVLTNDRQLEARLREKGFVTIRITTLRKAYEGAENVAENGRVRGGERRKPRQRMDEEEEKDSSEEEVEGGEGPSRQNGQKPADTIDGLIDRVG